MSNKRIIARARTDTRMYVYTQVWLLFFVWFEFIHAQVLFKYENSNK